MILSFVRMWQFTWGFINYSLHIGTIVAIYYFWQPISNWFLNKIPALGVDLYLSATYASYQLRNFSLPFNSFKDFWYGGNPLISDHPQLAFYLMMPFVAEGGPVEGVRKFTVYALFLLIFGCYLLFYKLSKNHGVAIFLAVAVLLSPNIYGAATWAGSIPYFFSQAMFPLGLFAGAFYLDKPSYRRLTFMVLVTAIGFMSNPLSMLAFLIPSLQLIIIFGGIHSKIGAKIIFGHIIFYNVFWLLAAFTVTFDTIKVSLLNFSLPGLGAGSQSVSGGGGDSVAAAKASLEIAKFYQDQIKLLVTRTHPWIFRAIIPGVVLFTLAFILAKKKRGIFLVIPFILIAVWSAAHPYINLGGIFNFFRHDPYRAFWQFPIAMGALAAVFWGYFFNQIWEWSKSRSYMQILYAIFSLTISGSLAVLAFVVFNWDIKRTLEINDTNIEFSSAFPEALSISTKKDELLRLKGELVPTFLNADDQNTRLYSADATVNIWWNVFFKMPMVRGYVDPPIGTNNRGGFFWLDIAIANDSLVRDFKEKEDVALNNALFLIDWYAVGFFEGGRLSSKGPSVGPSSYLLNNDVFDKEELITTHGAVLKYLDASGKSELVRDLPQNLHFYKVADNVTSPILYPTDSSVVAVASSNAGYEDVTRIFGFFNLNSKNIIPVHIPVIDRLSASELKSFDAVFLHQYEYHDQKKTFALLEKYVKDGGKVFIDTGSEAKESEGGDLPVIFPFKSSARRGFGKQWELSGEGDLLKGVDLSKFGPLIFAEGEWKLTVPQDGSLREGSKVILSHEGNPVLIERSLGKGTVIWSGMNLVYHFNQYKSDDEANLFMNILRDFADFSEKAPLAAKTQWLKPEKVTIVTNEAPRGILFKEQGYPGWKAKVVSGKSLPIYLTGPTYPGFMYVSMPSDVTGPVKVEFSYNATTLYWLVVFVNLIAIFAMLDLAILSGKMSRLGILVLGRVLGKRISSWWHKEDE